MDYVYFILLWYLYILWYLYFCDLHLDSNICKHVIDCIYQMLQMFLKKNLGIFSIKTISSMIPHFLFEHFFSVRILPFRIQQNLQMSAPLPKSRKMTFVGSNAWTDRRSIYPLLLGPLPSWAFQHRSFSVPLDMLYHNGHMNWIHKAEENDEGGTWWEGLVFFGKANFMFIAFRIEREWCEITAFDDWKMIQYLMKVFFLCVCVCFFPNSRMLWGLCTI